MWYWKRKWVIIEREKGGLVGTWVACRARRDNEACRARGWRRLGRANRSYVTAFVATCFQREISAILSAPARLTYGTAQKSGRRLRQLRFTSAVQPITIHTSSSSTSSSSLLTDSLQRRRAHYTQHSTAAYAHTPSTYTLRLIFLLRRAGHRQLKAQRRLFMLYYPRCK